ncbi:MAG: hypothetical protein ABSH08_05090 [Tepidisphaeraceae bacterium]|jgi:hypothetical protein
MSDALSPLIVKIMDANPHAYETLVVGGGTPALARELLDGVQPAQLLSTPAKAHSYAVAMLAGLWLWHDGLDECHRLVQNSPDAAGASTYSFWHAIMHRREGDFSNSKYWYARAAGHPALQTLTGQAGPLINRAPADNSLLRIIANGWNPNAFVDFVESLHENQSDARRPVAVHLQRLEWTVLWEHCVRFAAD